MSKSCFDFSEYREYLLHKMPVSGENRGMRSQLAKAMGVQSAFVSRVLHGDAHFSLEHGLVLNRYLNHTADEGDYFLLLLQKGRAGSKDLENYFQKKMDKIQEQRQVVAERIQVQSEMTSEDQMTYYSTWHCSAIHVLLLVPQFQTPEALSELLKIPLSTTRTVLEFLVKTGLAVEKEGIFQNGKNRIHLGRNSPILLRHHSNWRMRAIQAMDRNSDEDLFFSGPICLSESDAKKIREMLLKFLEQSEKIIGPSPEETVFCLGIDYFRL